MNEESEAIPVTVLPKKSNLIPGKSLGRPKGVRNFKSALDEILYQVAGTKKLEDGTLVPVDRFNIMATRLVMRATGDVGDARGETMDLKAVELIVNHFKESNTNILLQQNNNAVVVGPEDTQRRKETQDAILKFQQRYLGNQPS